MRNKKGTIMRERERERTYKNTLDSSSLMSSLKIFQRRIHESVARAVFEP